MNENHFKVPVALLLFNRPDLTARMFEVVRQLRPAKLFLVADGPRANQPGEELLCHQVHAVVEKIDWRCEVFRNYAETNLGCRARVASGLDWVFNQCDEAVILEDDCLPDPSFFPFCAELLERYRHDERIMLISGDNWIAHRQSGLSPTNDSYYFSRYPHIWGWATWRRAWQHYDVTMQSWPRLRAQGWLKQFFQGERFAAAAWDDWFQATYDGSLDTWDYQWTFACWQRAGLAIVPRANLVTNLGFRADGTHTQKENWLGSLPLRALTLPLQHPAEITRNEAADAYAQKHIFTPGWRWRLRQVMRTLLPQR